MFIILSVFAFLLLAILVFLVFIIRLYLFEKIRLEEKRYFYENLTQMFDSLNTARQIARNVIYLQDIIVFSANKVEISGKEMNQLSDKYVKLVLDMCPSQTRNDLVKYYGLENLCLLLKNEFNCSVTIEEDRLLNLETTSE